VFSAVEHVHVCLVAECIFVSGTLRTGTSSCARAVRYHTNAIVVSDFTIATRKWAKLHQHGVRQSVALKDALLLPCRTKLAEACMPLPLEVLQLESPANGFKLLPILCSCTDNFHMHDNHKWVVGVTHLPVAAPWKEIWTIPISQNLGWMKKSALVGKQFICQ